MTDICERLRYEMMPAAMSATRRAILEEAADEIERLRARLAIQFGMHPGGDLAKATSAEIERLTAVLLYISQLDDDGEAPSLARRALEPKP